MTETGTAQLPPRPRLGLRHNLGQFSLLVLVNAFVGAMVGMERSILPALAEEEFHLATRSAILSFIVVFGLTKALTNYLAGRFSDRWGRKIVLVAGWLVATPVPFMLMWAPSWSWILAANVLLGVSQGLTWSMTVIMKIDLAGPKKRGLAMGLNEFAGYLAVALSALATGWLAAQFGLRPQPFMLGIGFVVLGLGLSLFVVKETLGHVQHESAQSSPDEPRRLSPREVFVRTSLSDRNLSSVSQAGLVNNLNDGMAWGLFPLLFAGAGMSLREIGALAAIYPAVWGLGQLFTGAWSDRVGRKRLIVAGMWVQSAGIIAIAMGGRFVHFASGAVLLGAGTAMVYPTLLAAIGDVAHPSWRASAVGVYRLWRDSGYAVGAIFAGLLADALGIGAASLAVAGLTFLSGALVAIRMEETHAKAMPPPRKHSDPQQRQILQTGGFLLLQPLPEFGQSMGSAGQSMVHLAPIPKTKHTPCSPPTSAHCSSHSQASPKGNSPMPLQPPAPLIVPLPPTLLAAGAPPLPPAELALPVVAALFDAVLPVAELVASASSPHATANKPNATNVPKKCLRIANLQFDCRLGPVRPLTKPDRVQTALGRVDGGGAVVG